MTDTIIVRDPAELAERLRAADAARTTIAVRRRSHQILLQLHEGPRR